MLLGMSSLLLQLSTADRAKAMHDTFSDKSGESVTVSLLVMGGVVAGVWILLTVLERLQRRLAKPNGH